MSMNLAPIAANFNRPNNMLLNRSYKVKVEPVVASRKWTPVFVWSMTKAEMLKEGIDGQTVCFNSLLSTQGPPIWGGRINDRMGLSLRYGWNGEVKSAPFEKTWPEPAGNFAMGLGGEYWCEISDSSGVPSDRVTGITLANREDVDDPFAHHATLILWQLQEDVGGAGDDGDTDDPPVDEPGGGEFVTVRLASLRTMRRDAKALYESLLALTGGG